MRSLFFAIALGLLVTSCQNKSETPATVTETQKDTATSKDFEMYEMTEMALLMEQMFADNNRLRTEIMQGGELGKMPDHFQKIHSAQMTDPAENDEFFKEKAAEFLNAQALVYKEPAKAKEHFNEAVSACIECHQVKCGGPIPRIKKLYIK